MTAVGTIARFDFRSDLNILPVADAVSQQLCQLTGLDEESTHSVRIAVREALANAILHGNRSDARKRVFLEFESVGDTSGPALCVRIRDEGSGFDPSSVPDPCEDNNLLRPSGRGLLLMRSLLDELTFHRRSEGATEVVLVKRGAPSATS